MTHPTPEQSQAHIDGWIEHDGNGIPVSRATIVCIRVRDGQETPEHWMTPASDWNWRWAYGQSLGPLRSGEIMAYRVVPKPSHPALNNSRGE